MSKDRYITDEIRSTLERDERLPHPTEVAVSERHGTVTLRGSVGTFHQRRAAVRIARSTPSAGFPGSAESSMRDQGHHRGHRRVIGPIASSPPDRYQQSRKSDDAGSPRATRVSV